MGFFTQSQVKGCSESSRLCDWTPIAELLVRLQLGERTQIVPKLLSLFLKSFTESPPIRLSTAYSLVTLLPRSLFSAGLVAFTASSSEANDRSMFGVLTELLPRDTLTVPLIQKPVANL